MAELFVECLRCPPSMERIRQLVNANPEAVKFRTDDYGRIPLYAACRDFENGTEGPLEVVQYLVEQWPQSVKTADFYGDLPLHYACNGKVPLEVIRNLFEQWPESVKTAGNSGNLPLHCACETEAPLEVIQWLVEQWPESIKTANNEGELPLHKACSNAEGASLAVVQCLVQQWPESVEHRNSEGETPLAIAALQQHANIVVVDWLKLPWRARFN
jgi:ankyrin repeat protein